MRNACRRLDENGYLGREVVTWHKAETSDHSQEHSVWYIGRFQNLFSKVSLTLFLTKLLPMPTAQAAIVLLLQVFWSCR